MIRYWLYKQLSYCNRIKAYAFTVEYIERNWFDGTHILSNLNLWKEFTCVLHFVPCDLFTLRTVFAGALFGLGFLCFILISVSVIDWLSGDGDGDGDGGGR